MFSTLPCVDYVRPIPQEQFGSDLYLNLIEQGDLIPSDYPSQPLNLYTDEQFAQLIWRRDETARRLSRKCEVAAWLSVNQYVSVDWQTWLSLSDNLKRAIGIEVEELAQARQRSAKEQESKLESLMSKEALSLKFPNQTGSSIGRFLN